MPSASSTTFRFTGAASGAWRVLRADALRGAALAPSAFVAIEPADTAAPAPDAAWELRGFVSNVRYATRNESAQLKAVQEGLARPQATRAALIPLRKNAAWWDLPQDDRRAIFEETSHHTKIGLGYLPAVARRLYHARDLGEKFDFLTWFEFAPEHEASFDDLVARLRATHEWTYIEREIDIRLERADA
jgi:chlorite dismutase